MGLTFGTWVGNIQPRPNHFSTLGVVRFNLASIYYRPSVLSLNSVSSHPSGQFLLRSPSTLMKAVLCPSRRAVGIRPPSVASSLWCKDSTFILIYATLLTRNFEGLLKKVLKTPLQRGVGHILRMKIFVFIFGKWHFQGE